MCGRKHNCAIMAGKVKWLQAKPKRGYDRRLYNTGIHPSMAYGGAATGIAPTTTKFMRSMYINCAGQAGKGKCYLTLPMLMGRRWDPA